MSTRKGHSSYSLTNRGLSIKLPARYFEIDTYRVQLDCIDVISDKDLEYYRAKYSTFYDSSYKHYLGIFLRRLGEDDQYARTQHNGRTFFHNQKSFWEDESYGAQWYPITKLIKINVPQQCTESNTDYYHKDRINGFRVTAAKLLGSFTTHDADYYQDPEDKIVLVRSQKEGCLLTSLNQGPVVKAIKLGFDFDFNPICFVATSDELTDRKIPDRSQLSRDKSLGYGGIYS